MRASPQLCSIVARPETIVRSSLGWMRDLVAIHRQDDVTAMMRMLSICAHILRDHGIKAADTFDKTSTISRHVHGGCVYRSAGVSCMEQNLISGYHP